MRLIHKLHEHEHEMSHMNLEVPHISVEEEGRIWLARRMPEEANQWRTVEDTMSHAKALQRR